MRTIDGLIRGFESPAIDVGRVSNEHGLDGVRCTHEFIGMFTRKNMRTRVAAGEVRDWLSFQYDLMMMRFGV